MTHPSEALIFCQIYWIWQAKALTSFPITYVLFFFFHCTRRVVEREANACWMRSPGQNVTRLLIFIMPYTVLGLSAKSDEQNFVEKKTLMSSTTSTQPSSQADYIGCENYEISNLGAFSHCYQEIHVAALQAKNFKDWIACVVGQNYGVQCARRTI